MIFTLTVLLGIFMGVAIIHYVYERGRSYERALYLKRMRPQSNAGFKEWESAFNAEGILVRPTRGRVR